MEGEERWGGFVSQKEEFCGTAATATAELCHNMS